MYHIYNTQSSLIFINYIVLYYDIYNYIHAFRNLHITLFKANCNRRTEMHAWGIAVAAAQIPSSG